MSRIQVAQTFNSTARDTVEYTGDLNESRSLQFLKIFCWRNHHKWFIV